MSLRVIDAASYQGNMPQKNMDFDALIVNDYFTPRDPGLSFAQTH